MRGTRRMRRFSNSQIDTIVTSQHAHEHFRPTLSALIPLLSALYSQVFQSFAKNPRGIRVAQQHAHENACGSRSPARRSRLVLTARSSASAAASAIHTEAANGIRQRRSSDVDAHRRRVSWPPRGIHRRRLRRQSRGSLLVEPLSRDRQVLDETVVERGSTGAGLTR